MSNVVLYGVLFNSLIMYARYLSQHFTSTASSWALIRPQRHSIEWFQESISGILESCDPRIELFAGHPPGVFVNNEHIELSDTLLFRDSRVIFDDIEPFSVPPSSSRLLMVEIDPELTSQDSSNLLVVNQVLKSFDLRANKALQGSLLYSARKDAVLTKRNSEEIVDCFLIDSGVSSVVSSLLLSRTLHAFAALIGLGLLLDLAVTYIITTVRFPVRYQVGDLRPDNHMITLPLSAHTTGETQAPERPSDTPSPPPAYEETETAM